MLNNSMNFSIEVSPNEVTIKIKIINNLKILEDLPLKNYIKFY